MGKTNQPKQNGYITEDNTTVTVSTQKKQKTQITKVPTPNPKRKTNSTHSIHCVFRMRESSTVDVWPY